MRTTVPARVSGKRRCETPSRRGSYSHCFRLPVPRGEARSRARRKHLVEKGAAKAGASACAGRSASVVGEGDQRQQTPAERTLPVGGDEASGAAKHDARG